MSLAYQWLLLDVPMAPEARANLRRHVADRHSIALFEGTDLHPWCEQGPRLIDLAQCPALGLACHGEPLAWPGLLLASEASLAHLLEHLRRMLTVTLGLHHKALLSYYNPHTASYFFDACDARELSLWLGPLSRVRWFGGTWADRAIGSLGWQQLSNPGLDVAPLAIEENLSPRQQDKLQLCLLEQHAWRWSRATGSDFQGLWSYLQEGLAHGFTERPVLDGWLRLRLQHPLGRIVQPLAGQTQQERLDNLRDRWQNNQS